MRVATPKQVGVARAQPVSLVATWGADDAVVLNAVVLGGAEALLFPWRGYADPASRTCPGPGFHAPRGLLAETLTSLLLAKGAHLGAVRGELRRVALLSGGWRSRRLLDSG